MRFLVQSDGRDARTSEVEAGTSEEAALAWALERLLDDEEDRCLVSIDGVAVAKFHMSKEWTAMEMKL